MIRRPAMKLRKWLAAGMLAMLGVGLLSGCQPIFMTREVYEDAHKGLLPAKLEQDHVPITGPVTAMTPKPPTVNNPERPPYYLTLQEAIATSLENGHVSARGPGGGGGGFVDDSLASFSGPGSLNAQTERLRVLAMNPAISNAAMEGSVSRYDAVYNSNIIWTGTDNVQTGLFSSTNGHGATYTSSIIKPLPSGGIVDVAFVANYQNLNSPPFGAFNVLNPQYTLRPHIGFEQPLWKDWGEINQLLPRFPTGTGQSLPSLGTLNNLAINNRLSNVSSFVDRSTEGILISRLRFDQSRAEFERNVQILVTTTEVAYWNLYNKYGQLYSVEENLRVMHKSWQESYNRWRAGNLDPDKYYQVLGQFEEFRGERVRALSEVLEAERNLRGIMGKPSEDGTRLVPITPPTMTEFRPDWDESLQQALTQRPELVLARDNLRYHQYLLAIQNNSMKPDLRFFARYEPVGFGNTLQGNGTFLDGTTTVRTTNAAASLRSFQFADYQMGINLNIPIGYRFEHAAMRAARLELAQSYYLLRDQEDRATRFLTKQFQEVAHWYKRIEVHRAERIGYLESLKKRQQQIDAGKRPPGDLEFLESQRRYAAALIKEYNAIAEYNNSLARFEWAKGAAMQYNNIQVSEGALPEAAQVRAVEHQKERARSLVLRERPDSLYHPGRLVAANAEELQDPEALRQVMDSKFTPPPPSLPVLADDKATQRLPRITDTPQREETRSAVQPQKMPLGLKALPTTQPTGPALTPTTFRDEQGPAPTTGSGVVTVEVEMPARMGLGVPASPAPASNDAEKIEFRAVPQQR